MANRSTRDRTTSVARTRRKARQRTGGIMRTSQEIRDELRDIRINYGTDETQYTEEIAGWIDALKWVLSEYEGE